jgi:sugar phosphate isomerase/epimerase
MLKPLINHIHIKDRNKFKMNVVLGTGIINFKSFFRLLKKLKYNRDITLETNRGCDAISTGYRNLVLVEKLMKS